ncbi:MAG: hypothetical protein B5M48_01635 [Candidatus Omnitrophica bacterium 4484_213]|nr:MAG: hypothetical protein B5M48_01635 [Candidatus Omnitrophica bacterium 4484_213]
MAQKLIGIDIGERFTKVVEIKGGFHPVLLNADIFATPYFEQKGGKKNIDKKKVLSLITHSIPLKKLSGFLMGIYVPSFSVRAAIFTFPQMPLQELSIAVVSEAREKMLPVVAPGKTVFDYFVLSKKIIEDDNQKQIRQLDVLVARAEKEIVEGRTTLFKKEGILPDLVTALPFTLADLLPADLWKGKENIAFVNIEFSTMDIFFVRERKLRFFHNVNFGIQEVISGISRVMKIPQEQAFRILREYDILATDRRSDSGEQSSREGDKFEKDILPELKLVFQSYAERVAAELKRSFIYYKQQEKEITRIEKFFFSGEGSIIKNLLIELNKRVGGSLEILNPFQFVKPNPKGKFPPEISEQAPLFASVCALALNLNVPEKERINFLPLSLKKRKKISRFRLFTLLTAGFLFCFFLVVYCNLFFSARSTKFSLAEQKEKIKGLSPLIKQYDEFRKQEQKLENIFSVAAMLEKQAPPCEQILSELAYQISEEITLSSFHIQKKKDKPEQRELKLEGYITANYEDACKILNDFKNTLKKSNYFKNISSSTLDLEPVVPVVTKSEEIILTEVKQREFTLTADLPVKSAYGGIPTGSGLFNKANPVKVNSY